MSSLSGIPVSQTATSRNQLQRGVEHASVESVLESLVHVADLPEFVFDPAGVDFFPVLTQSRGGRIALLQSFERGLCGKHATLDRQMNSLYRAGVEEAGRVAQDHPSAAGDGRNCPPSPVRHRLRSVADHLAAFEKLRHKGMLLEFLQDMLRVEARIGGGKAERH